MMSSALPRIYVLAGVNGAGKSSIGGAAFRHFGSDYFNPDCWRISSRCGYMTTARMRTPRKGMYPHPS